MFAILVLSQYYRRPFDAGRECLVSFDRIRPSVGQVHRALRILPLANNGSARWDLAKLGDEAHSPIGSESLITGFCGPATSFPVRGIVEPVRDRQSSTRRHLHSLDDPNIALGSPRQSGQSLLIRWAVVGCASLLYAIE